MKNPIQRNKSEKEKQYKAVIIVLLLVVIFQGLFILLNRPAKPVKPKPQVIKKAALPKEVKGKIAIVLDDWGYNLADLEILAQIKAPLTLSVLPALPYSAKVAETAYGRGDEIILHLPMQPHEKYHLEDKTILTTMNEKEIKAILDRDLASVPYCKGVSNHMGSLVTEDEVILTEVFSELKKKNLFFLDSYVTNKSVAEGVARNAHLRFAKRDIFLDNQSDPEEIKRQIAKLKSKARVNGSAIGIGHDRKGTLAVLKEVIPELEKEGYKFVHLSELVD